MLFALTLNEAFIFIFITGTEVSHGRLFPECQGTESDEKDAQQDLCHAQCERQTGRKQLAADGHGRRCVVVAGGIRRRIGRRLNVRSTASFEPFCKHLTGTDVAAGQGACHLTHCLTAAQLVMMVRRPIDNFARHLRRRIPHNHIEHLLKRKQKQKTARNFKEKIGARSCQGLRAD